LPGRGGSAGTTTARGLIAEGALGETLTALGAVDEGLIPKDANAGITCEKRHGVLRRLTGHNKDEVTGECIKLYDGKIHNLNVYSYSAI
jgi:hypothetical protein